MEIKIILNVILCTVLIFINGVYGQIGAQVKSIPQKPSVKNKVLAIKKTTVRVENKRMKMVNINVFPKKVYIERSEFSQYINFDFLLENLSGEDLEINTIQVLVLDSEDKLLLRKFINKNGAPASIYTLPDIKLKRESSLFVFNPLYSFDSDLEIAKLQYEFFFDSPDKPKKYKSTVNVNPVYYETKTDLIFPLKDRFTVFDGHDFYSHHRRLDFVTHPMAKKIGIKSNSGRYAYDFCVVNDKGDLYRNDGGANQDWFGLGVPVYSPGNGEIVEVVDNMENNILGEKMFDFSQVEKNPDSMAGNYVIIDHKNGEYSLIGHLQKGKTSVKVGDKVEQGARIAQMGFSGATAWWMHIHYELRNGKDTFTSEGLPSYFKNFRRIRGSKTIEVKKGQIDTGDIVESCR